MRRALSGFCSIAVVSSVVVALASPASAAAADVTLDPGSSGLPLQLSVSGSSNAGVILQTAPSGSVAIGSASLVSGSAVSPLAAPLDGKHPVQLVGQFATMAGYSAVSFLDLATPGRSGSTGLAIGSRVITGGPDGWVELNDTTGKVDYVQPTGTGAGAAVTRTTLATLPVGNTYLNVSATANPTGLLLGTNCSASECGPQSSLRFYPWATGVAATLYDAAGSWASSTTPVTSLTRAAISAIACPSTTLCLAADQGGGIARSTNAVGGSGTWTLSVVDPTAHFTALSCATTTFCMVAQDDGSVRYSTSPATGLWSAAQVATVDGGISALSCPTTTLCVASTGGNLIATTTPTSAGSWAASPIANQLTSIDCPSASLCVGATLNGSVLFSSTPGSPASWTPSSLITGYSPVVSCPSESFCALVDSTGYVSTTSSPASDTWSVPSQPNDTSGGNSLFGAVAVSCPSASRCTLLDDGGTTWSSSTPTDVASWLPTGAPGYGHQRLTCRSTLCVAGSYGGSIATSTDSAATFDTGVAVSNEVPNTWRNVSCPEGTTFCLGLDQANQAVTSTNGGVDWAGPYSLGNAGAVSCVSATACIAIDSFDGTVTNTTDPTAGPSAWGHPAATGPDGVMSLSCASLSLCVSVTYYGDIFTSIDAFGATPHWVKRSGLLANANFVSCATGTTFCVLAAPDGRVRTSSTPTTATWSAPVQALQSGESLLSLHCRSSTFCVGVTDFGLIASTSSPAAANWHLTYANVGDGNPVSVSCPSTTLCVAAGYSGATAVSTTPLVADSWVSGADLGANAQQISCPSTTSCVLTRGDGSTATTTTPGAGALRTTSALAADDAGDVAWYYATNSSADTLDRISTSSATPVSRTAIGDCATAITVTAARSAWFDYCSAPQPKWIAKSGTGGIHSIDVGPPSYLTDFHLGSDGTGLYYTRADTLANNGLYRLDDATTTPVKVSGTGGNSDIGADHVAVSPGRVSYTDTDPSPAVARPQGELGLWTRTLSPTLALGSKSLVAKSASGFTLATSGRRTLTQDVTTRDLRVYGEATPLAIPSDFYGAEPGTAEISGHRVLFPAGSAGYKLYDERTNATTTLPTTTSWKDAALWGRYAAAIRDNGEVVRRDLTTGATTLVAAAPVLPAGEYFDGWYDVEVAGTVVSWLYGTYTDSGVRSYVAGYRDSLDGVTHPITVTGDADTPKPRLRLSREYAVYTTGAGTSATAIKLSDGTSSTAPITLPVATYGFQVPALEVDGSTLGYVASDGRAHVAQLDATTHNAPVVLSAWTPTHATTGTSWVGDVVTSAPLTTCSFTIKSGATLIRTLACNAAQMAMGEATASWDGKNSGATQQPVGNYTWTLDAANADGPVLRDDLTANPTTGSIALAAPVHELSFTGPSSTTSSWVVKFSGDVYGASSSNTKLLTSTGGAVTATTSCLSASNVAVSCTGPARSVRVTPAGLVPGSSYKLVVNPAGTTVPLKDIAAAKVTAYSSPVLRVLHADDVSFSEAWGAVVTSTSIGGSYVTEGRTGATLTAKFTGTGVRLWYVKRADAGRVKVTIDGVVKSASLDEYASTTQTKKYVTYTGLSSATHTLVVTVLGTRATASKGTLGTVDAISTATATCSTTSGCTQSPGGQRWAVATVGGAFAGKVAASDTYGASIVRTFWGTGFDLYRLVGTTQGQMNVYVDGALAATVNNYATSNAIRPWSKAGLPNKLHTLKVVVLHKTGKTGTSAYSVTLDRLTAR